MASVTVIGGSGFLGRHPLKIMGARAKPNRLWHEKLGTGRGSTSL